MNLVTHNSIKISSGFVDSSFPRHSANKRFMPINIADSNPLLQSTVLVKPGTVSFPVASTKSAKNFRTQRLCMAKTVPVKDQENDPPEELTYEESVCERLDKYLQSLKSLRSELQKIKPSFNVPLLLEKTRPLCFSAQEIVRRSIPKKTVIRSPSVKLLTRKQQAARPSENKTDELKKKGTSKKGTVILPRVHYKRSQIPKNSDDLVPLSAKVLRSSQIKFGLSPK